MLVRKETFVCLAIVAMATIDPATLQNLLQQVAGAAKAAAEASRGSSSTPSGSTSDGSKLLTKPSVFDHKSLDDEIDTSRSGVGG